jgi:hypothetical protein
MNSRFVAYAALMLLVGIPASGRSAARVESDNELQASGKPGPGAGTPGAKSSTPPAPSQPLPGPGAGTPGAAHAAPPPAPSSPATPYPSPDSDRAAKEAKLTGCVQAGTSPGGFELTGVKKGMGENASSASSPSASAGASASGKSGNVKLSTAAGVDLAAQVGHTVEVTGSWRAGDSASSPSAAAPAPSASASAGGDKTFQVKSIKMVSSLCSAGI